jgi:hypothetical protein
MESTEFDLMITITAHLIIIPYLWMFGYPTDKDSVHEARDSIAIQEREMQDEECAFTFIFVDSE